MNKLGILLIPTLYNPEIEIYDISDIIDGKTMEVTDNKIILKDIPIENFDALNLNTDLSNNKNWREKRKYSFINLNDEYLYSGELMVVKSDNVRLVSKNLNICFDFELLINKKLDLNITKRFV